MEVDFKQKRTILKNRVNKKVNKHRLLVRYSSFVVKCTSFTSFLLLLYDYCRDCVSTCRLPRAHFCLGKTSVCVCTSVFP